MPLIRPLQPGQSIGGYELIRTLFEGALATTWQARGAEGQVALKTIPVVALDDPDMEDVFLEETERARSVAHPNVARLLGSSLDKGYLCAASEWVDGSSLAALLKASGSEKLPADVALRVVFELCDAVAAVHAIPGLLHRSVSPGNVMVSPQGAVKLIDVGVSAVLSKSSSSTTFRHMVGKFSYLSPEQLWSRPIDARSDVFSLGLVCCELLTGAHPFRGRHDRETTSSILSQAPATVPPGAMPAALEAWVLRALAKDPSARFADAIVMRDELAQAAGVLPLASPAALAAWLASSGAVPPAAPTRLSSRPPPQAPTAPAPRPSADETVQMALAPPPPSRAPLLAVVVVVLVVVCVWGALR